MVYLKNDAVTSEVIEADLKGVLRDKKESNALHYSSVKDNINSTFHRSGHGVVSLDRRDNIIPLH